jgi:hypothetical protein
MFFSLGHHFHRNGVQDLRPADFDRSHCPGHTVIKAGMVLLMDSSKWRIVCSSAAVPLYLLVPTGYEARSIKYPDTL